MALSSLNPRIRDLQRQLIGYAEDIEMDAAGRVLVSPALREFAALEKNVVLVGQGNKFELWDRTQWEQVLGAVPDSPTASCRPNWRVSRCEHRLTYPGPIESGGRWFESAGGRNLRRCTFGRGGHSREILARLGKRRTCDRAGSRS